MNQTAMTVPLTYKEACQVLKVELPLSKTAADHKCMETLNPVDIHPLVQFEDYCIQSEFESKSGASRKMRRTYTAITTNEKVYKWLLTEIKKESPSE